MLDDFFREAIRQAQGGWRKVVAGAAELGVLALGGLYIVGGVAARNPEILTHANFREEFQGSPTMGQLLAKIPAFLIDNQDSGLWGAAFLGRQILQKG